MFADRVSAQQIGTQKNARSWVTYWGGRVLDAWQLVHVSVWCLASQIILLCMSTQARGLDVSKIIEAEVS